MPQPPTGRSAGDLPGDRPALARPASESPTVRDALRMIWRRRRAVLAAAAACVLAALAASSVVPSRYAAVATLALGDRHDPLEYRARLREPGAPERLLAARGITITSRALDVNLQRRTGAPSLVLTVHADQGPDATRAANGLAEWLVASAARTDAEHDAAIARAAQRLAHARHQLATTQLAARLDTTDSDFEHWLTLVARLPEVDLQIRRQQARLAALTQQLQQLAPAARAGEGVEAAAARGTVASPPHALHDPLHRDVLAARAELAALRAEYSGLVALRGAPEWQARLAASEERRDEIVRLTRELRVAEAAHDRLARPAPEADAGAEDDRTPRLITAADVPNTPVSPRPLAAMALAGFVGLLLACAAAVVLPDRSPRADVGAE